LAHYTSRSLIDAEDRLLSTVSDDGETLIIDGHLLELFFVDLRSDKITVIVFDGLGVFFSDSDPYHGGDRVVSRLGTLRLNRLFSLHSRLLRIFGWYTSHLINLQLDLWNPGQKFLSAQVRHLRVKSVEVPETFEGKVENTRR
jgi:hypothetical protein